ncbi:hypothetical protein LR48_Vigan10g188800 [Vigna angularis]|uniref:Uncharacterized protein n=1 Tax=Phaseolus angularis TaxID=3914 RepID=A0A0L9VLS6_PHAAN|nr:hypothetical protein LR48_Vigan10g188800 [Vigna angularis]
MAESPHSSGDEVPTTSRRTRGATRLQQLILRRNAGERTPIIIDIVTRVASGPNADVFRSYLGVLARDRISILTPSFDLGMTFDMPNVKSLRNRYMAESPHSSGDEVPTTSRRTRGATRLQQLILRRNAGERTPIIIDIVTRVASGPNADVFRSYLGVLARDRISILTPSFDLGMTFDMPNVKSLRNRCLSAIAERFRGFKTKLTSRYIFGPKSNETPCSKYSAIVEETWRQFVEFRSSETWQKSDSRLPLSEGGDPPPPPSPPSRHEKWKLARIRPSSSYTFDYAREISERISSQGQFTQEGRQDILATTIGRPEHLGRVRAAGTSIGIRQFFESSSRPSSSGLSKEYEQKLKEEIRKEITQEITKKCNRQTGSYECGYYAMF